MITPKPITVVGLAQTSLIIVIFLLTSGFMKVHGYPETGPWPYLCLFYRHSVFYLILVPLLWSFASVLAAQRGTFLRIGETSYLIIGIVILLALSLSGVFSIILALAGPPLRF